jgi:excisionase family DNA binding protein
MGGKLLTVGEVAGRLGVSESLVYAWVEGGTLPHYRFGRSKGRGKIMVDPDDLAAFVAAMKVGGRGGAGPITPRPSASAPASSGPPVSPFSELDPARLSKAWEGRR